MATDPTDTNLDDPSCLDYFMKWALEMADPSSTGDAKDSHHKPDPSSTPPVRPMALESAEEVGVARQEVKDEVKKDPPPLPLSSTAHTVPDSMEPKPNGTHPSKNMTTFATPVPSPVVSIARKPVKKHNDESYLTSNLNKLDDTPDESHMGRSTTMTPTQARLAQKSDPARFDTEQHPSRDVLEERKLGVKKAEVVGHTLEPESKDPAAAHSEIEAPQGLVPESSMPKKSSGLINSMHARNTTATRVRPRQIQTIQQSARSSNTGASHTYRLLLSSDQMKDGRQHDPMSYFENKRKEFFPTVGSTASVIEKVLQTKDPNTSAPAAREAISKLNPNAQEYEASPQIQSTAKAEGEFQEQHVLENEQQLEISGKVKLLASDDTETETRAKDADDAILTGMSTKSPSLPCSNLKHDPDEGEPDTDLDLTPLLNVLGSRPSKTRKTVVDTKVETENSTINKSDNLGMDVSFQSLKQTSSNSGVARTIVIRNLPKDNTYTLVQSLIGGATIASMKLSSEEKCAHVKLTDAQDCEHFLTSCKNGIEFKHNGEQHVVYCELSTELDEHDEVLQAYLDCGASRAVLVDDVDMDLTMRALHDLGTGPTASRAVEGISDLLSGGVRRIIFRFADIYHAVAFRAALRRNVDWKNKKTEFVDGLET